MHRIAEWLAAPRGWRRAVGALALGATAALALPPFHVLPALIIAFTGLVWLLDGCTSKRGAVGLGWCFGYGQFVVGLYWTGNALLTDAERFSWMVPFAVLGLPAILALFPAAATLATYLSRAGGLVHSLTRPVVLAVAWTAAEWLRGHVLSGFPWNLVGYAWTVSDAVLQVTALVGIHGLGFLTVLAAAVPATLAGQALVHHRWLPSVVALLGLAALWLGGTLRLSEAAVAEFEGVRLRLVQANIDQHHKWRDDRRRAQLERYLQLSSNAGADSVSHIIWPETAIPYFLANEPKIMALIGGLVAPSGAVIAGAPRTTAEPVDPPRIWNSLHAVGAAGTVLATYDKHHLVPFGEYVPLHRLLARLGVAKVTSGSIDFSAGSGPRTVVIDGLPPFAALICYEAIFPDQIVDRGERPAWLLNITNDAWFGDSSGPYQHFAMARVRAVEQGLALVRTANTGISAIIDPYGRVRARLALGHHGVIDGGLPLPLDPPPYARWGDGTALALMAITASLLTVVVRVTRRKQPKVTGV